MLHPPLKVQDVAMIGLGTGGMAMYMKPDQSMTIFELDPDNLPLADQWFSYLEQSRQRGAKLKFEFGDGRLLLQQHPDDAFDVLILDAFNSGSIPTHLLTLEALQEYQRVLREPGLILLHISNKALSLSPLIFGSARASGLFACEASNFGIVDPDAEPTQWAAISGDPELIRRMVTVYGWTPAPASSVVLPDPWTDQFSNILALLLWK